MVEGSDELRANLCVAAHLAPVSYGIDRKAAGQLEDAGRDLWVRVRSPTVREGSDSLAALPDGRASDTFRSRQSHRNGQTVRHTSTEQLVHLRLRRTQLTNLFLRNDPFPVQSSTREFTDFLEPGAQPLVFHSQEMF